MAGVDGGGVNTITERKPCTIHDLAGLVGTIDALTMGDAESSILCAQIDRAVAADKQAFHARNDRRALETQIRHDDIFNKTGETN